MTRVTAPPGSNPSWARRCSPFGKYLLLDRIAVGGMAEVYRAKAFDAEGIERIVAIKRMLPSMAEDEEFVSMFVDEARIVGRLSHANIVPIFELGRIGESPFIAMQFVWGKDLLQIINRFRKTRTHMPPAMAAFLAARVCEALDYAHRTAGPDGEPLGIVHRDVSPQNILVSYEGEVKVVDFGIAKARSRSTRTQAGVLKGKFGYMSPEQARGEALDRRSDIFAVGTCLYEMLTLERLFLSEADYHTLEKIRNVEFDPPSKRNPDIPPELERIVLKALTRSVETRWQWASDLAEALERFVLSQRPVFNTKRLGSWMKSSFAPEIATERARMAEDAVEEREYTSIDLTGSRGSDMPPGGEATAPSFLEGREGGGTFISDPRWDPQSALGESTQVFYSNEAALLAAPILHTEVRATPFPTEDSSIESSPSGEPSQVRVDPRNAPMAGTASRARRATPQAGLDPLAPAGSSVGAPELRTTPRPSRPRSAAAQRRNVVFVAAALFCATTLLFGALYLFAPPDAGSAASTTRLFVSSAPAARARILLDGKHVGRTPLVLESLPPGKHVVEAEGLGGIRVRRSVNLVPGETRVVLMRVESEP